MKYISEDVDSPTRLLRIYGIGVVAMAVVIVLAIRSVAYVVAMLLLPSGIPLTVFCSYHVSNRHSGAKRLFRLKLALVTAVACGILMSEVGKAATMRISPLSGFICGTLSGCLAYLLAIVVDSVATLSLRAIRSFIMPGFCSQCGYNLTGLTSERCPECGILLDRRVIRLEEPRWEHD